MAIAKKTIRGEHTFMLDLHHEDPINIAFWLHFLDR
jgi:hypothetical protein